jgi:hypothetical protein
MAQCSKHLERKAVGTCLSCGKYLCDECVAQKRGTKVLCYDCAVKVSVEEFSDKEKRDRTVASVRKERALKGARKNARTGLRPFTLLVIIGAVVILLQGAVILADYLVRSRGETSVTRSATVRMRYERDLCAGNLHRLAGAVEEYRKGHDGSLPADLDGLFPGGDDSILRCPATGLPYSYTVRGNSFILSCPSPAAHDLLFLVDEDGNLQWQKTGE